ncbi:hypothetical protein [Thermococcus barophilus]|uniref:Uncharacterized protein n=1 Tax=Thermococcus barophilus TaxID=55802 RepID=A0A0S1XBN4_THEBA|nr:hypothetical protein [Thermococcus barophilus]ALM75201.1 membrane hypothetical protein [Thermococcus barophilus]
MIEWQTEISAVFKRIPGFLVLFLTVAFFSGSTKLGLVLFLGLLIIEATTDVIIILSRKITGKAGIFNVLIGIGFGGILAIIFISSIRIK